jgi:hypothetical protein
LPLSLSVNPGTWKEKIVRYGPVDEYPVRHISCDSGGLMAIEILSYTTSILNPGLKLLVFAAFVLAAVFFYRCWHIYGGILHDISTLLLIGAFAGVFASGFRLLGDLTEQVKWGETLFDLVLAMLMLMIALAIRSRMARVAQLFGPEEGDVNP